MITDMERGSMSDIQTDIGFPYYSEYGSINVSSEFGVQQIPYVSYCRAVLP